MTIDFTCQKCEASFEVEAQDLIDGTAKLVCPHCETKCPSNLVEDFVAAFTEMRAQIAVMSKKFGVTMALETEELEDELDEDEEEDDASESDEDELDFEDDEDDDDDEVEDEDTDEP